MISKSSTLSEVAFTVCTALQHAGLTVVLVGGSAATYYAPEAYQSYDADFVAQFIVNRARETKLVAIMQSLGYTVDRNLFVHSDSPFSVEFPKGPLAVGGDVIGSFDTVRRDEELLHIITPTDSVRDRLAKFYF